MGDYAKIQLKGDQQVGEEEVAKGRRYRLTWEDRPLLRFQSQEQMLQVMSEIDPATGKPFYNDPIYRASVQDIIANSRGVEGVWSNTPAPNHGNVDVLEGMRLEALRQKAEEMHIRMASPDRVKAYEAAKWVVENEEAVRQAQEVYGAPPGHDMNQSLMANKGDNRIQHETGSVSGDKVIDRAPMSEEHQNLIADLEANGKVS